MNTFDHQRQPAMRAILIVSILSLTMHVTRAQTETRYIEVMGSAEMEVTPNIIVISIRLKEYEENKEKVLLEKIDKDFLAAVSRSKIDKEKISLANLRMDAFQKKRRDRDYFAEKTYQIEFSATTAVLTFLENLKDVKLDYLYIVKQSHTELEKYRMDIKVQALKAAEKKADVLLSAVGSKRGKPLLIDESPDQFRPYAQNMQSNMVYSLAEDVSIDSSEIPLADIKLRSEIRARFEIE
jgi:uncharacterized protein YggE